MPHASFVHLRVRSAYSLLESTIRYDELVRECRSHGMPAIAVTDTANLFGVMEFCAAAKKAGIQPIVGALLPLTTDDTAGGRLAARPTVAEHVVVLVQDATGYANLLKLVTAAHEASDQTGRPHLTSNLLERYAQGLLLLTGGATGPVGAALLRGDHKGGEALLARLARAFPGRLYVELHRHGLAEQRQVEPSLVELAYRHGLPLVATNDVHFLDDRGYEACDALVCIADGAQLAQTERRRLSVEQRLKSPVEMASLFADLPEAVANTVVVAQRCAFMAPARAPILPSFPTTGDWDEAEELRVRARSGLADRLARLGTARGVTQDTYRERLEFELGVIVQMRFPGYFLIVADFIQWAKDSGIPVGPGRGSGAGSVVAWALRITDLDPLRFGLLFERFLNPERVSMPDFDIDFCQDRRDDVIRYVQSRYGRDRVAHIITFGRLQARAALRDVGRVLGLPFGQVDRLCKMVPQNPANPISLAQALELEPQLKDARAREPEIERLFDIALQLEGLPRNASTHAAGIVIGDRPLAELVPLSRDPRTGMPVTQFNMKDVEKAGLVKFDFLGLSTLTMLRLAERLVNNGGAVLSLDDLPLDDTRTYELLGRAETAGIFQLESSGMRDALRKLRPDCFDDIVALVSLYRPGPMDNIPRYTNVKHGVEQAEYLHESLEPILAETNGVIIYQEQVMEIAKQLAGYTLGGADLLRRAMGKKIKAEMDAQREVFIAGATRNGVRPDLAATIFEQVAKFASYGFNKSHAAAYALLAYQTAYLKANHPVEFYAAAMTIELGNHDKLAMFRREMLEKGILLLPPDINASEAEFAVEVGTGGIGVRYALAGVKGVGLQAARALVAARQAAGPFRDLDDLCRRVGGKILNKRLLESLIKAGTLDAFDANRRRLNEDVDTALRTATVAAEDADAGQVSLFADVPVHGPSSPPARLDISDWPLMERLAMELDAVGFYMSAHPLDGYRSALRKLGVVDAAHLRAELGGRDMGRLRLAGVVVGKQERTTDRTRFAFVQLSDPSGTFEVTVWSDLLARIRDLLAARAPLLLDVEARQEGDALRLIAQRIEALDEAVDASGVELEIRVADAAVVRRLEGLLRQPGPRAARVRLVLPTSRAGEEATILLPPDVGLRHAGLLDVERAPGVLGLRELGRAH